MKSFCVIPAIMTLAALFLSGCAGEGDEQQQMLAEMRLEIDQLTNAVGRLEFRVSQLEDQLGAATVSESVALPDEAAVPPVDIEPSAGDKRYDLAPVE